MELPSDLKNYRPSEDDPFQLISPELAVVIFVVCALAGYFLAGFQ